MKLIILTLISSSISFEKLPSIQPKVKHVESFWGPFSSISVMLKKVVCISLFTSDVMLFKVILLRFKMYLYNVHN